MATVTIVDRMNWSSSILSSLALITKNWIDKQRYSHRGRVLGLEAPLNQTMVFLALVFASEVKTLALALASEKRFSGPYL